MKKALKSPLKTIRETFREDRTSTHAPSMVDIDEVTGKYQTPDFLLTDNESPDTKVPSKASIHFSNMLQDNN